jgi:lysophospholipase L1-like esterase
MSGSVSSSVHSFRDDPVVGDEEEGTKASTTHDGAPPPFPAVTRVDPVGEVRASDSTLLPYVMASSAVGEDVDDGDDDEDERASLVSCSDDDDDDDATPTTTRNKTRAVSRGGRLRARRPSPSKHPRRRLTSRGHCRRLIGALRPLLCLGEVFMGVAVFAFMAFVLVVIPEYGHHSSVTATEFPELIEPRSEECQNWTITNLDAYLDRYKTDFVVACVGGGSDCGCPNPVIGSMPQDSGWWNESWQFSNEKNRERIQDTLDQGRKLDVVLLGDSITEHWQGTDLGGENDEFRGNNDVYNQLFNSPDSPIQGLALGNGGDRTTQLLYRLEHGEITMLSAPVFWILIGTNDFLGFFCDPDEIVAGILACVREVRRQKPSSTVVLQALLPVSANEAHDLLYWRAYSEVNQRLSCFAEQAPLVEFVNMTQLVLTEDGKVDISLLVDGIHPGENASLILGDEIVRVVKHLLSTR